MKKESWLIAVVMLSLLAGSAFFLHQRSQHQKLSEPGLRLVREQLFDPEGKVVAEQSVALPHELPGGLSKPMPISKGEIGTLPRDTIFGRRVYRTRENLEALISVVLMGSDRTSIHKPQYCLTGQGWTIEKTEVASVPMQRPTAYDLKVMKLTTSRDIQDDKGKPVLDAKGKVLQQKGLYVYWFVDDHRLTPDHKERMWWMARDLVTEGVLHRWAYVTYFTHYQPGEEEETFNRLKRFIAESTPEFQLTAPGATAQNLRSSLK